MYGGDCMNCTLMNKRHPIAEISMNENDGYIEKILDVYSLPHLPVGVSVVGGLPDKTELNRWWRDRSIPASRDGLKESLEEMGLHDSKELITKGLGLSLSDQYWIKPQKSTIQWDDVNFFKNDFSKDVGEILFRESNGKEQEINWFSPDNTSDGWLKKKWTIINGDRYLLKGGSGPYFQEPFNEVIATKMIQQLNSFPGVSYEVQLEKNGKPYCLCKNFITEDTEFVTAYSLAKSLKKSNNDSHYMHLVRCMNEAGIQNGNDQIDFMLLCDYVLANTDRHWGNFGFIRDVNTLQYVGVAPIFDNGTSLWHDAPNMEILAIKTCKSYPFRKTHEEQIQLVKQCDGFAVQKLKGFEVVVDTILKKNPYLDHERRGIICRAVKGRIAQLEKHIKKTLHKKNGQTFSL